MLPIGLGSLPCRLAGPSNSGSYLPRTLYLQPDFSLAFSPTPHSHPYSPDDFLTMLTLPPSDESHQAARRASEWREFASVCEKRSVASCHCCTWNEAAATSYAQPTDRQLYATTPQSFSWHSRCSRVEPKAMQPSALLSRRSRPIRRFNVA